jgi:hypothetical protein
MSLKIEQIAEEALALPSEARRRRDEARNGNVKTIPGDKALAQVRRTFSSC